MDNPVAAKHPSDDWSMCYVLLVLALAFDLTLSFSAEGMVMGLVANCSLVRVNTCESDLTASFDVHGCSYFAQGYGYLAL